MSGHSQPLSIRLLGTVSFRQGNGEETAIDAPRLQSLLALLLLHPQGPLSRTQLAFTLWPDASEAAAYNNLRQLLHRLRRLLPAAERFLEVDAQKVWWQRDAPCCVDVALFEDALQHAATPAELSAALFIYTGDLLPGCYDDWIVPHRTRLRQKYVQGLHDLISRLQQQGAYDEAIATAQRLVEEEPLEEEGYQRLMYLYAQKREQTSIERVYRQCVEVMEQELDLPPSPALEESYQRLIEVAAVEKHHNLPTQSTTFVGRATELANLAERLSDPQCRLLSLIGPGGIGKTRLALRLAEHQAVNFLHGVVYVSLVGLAIASHLSTAIATAAGIPFQDNQPADAQLLKALRHQERLLVLDNYEHLVPDTRLIEHILAEAPGIKVLVTTRARLGLRAEWLYLVPGLDLPQNNEDGAKSGAMQLFAQRARQVDPHFSPDETNRQAMAQVCRLVGGMPLGIELAASWARLLPCQEILDQIQHNLDLLETTLHDVPQRHRSLRAIFDQTWRSLSAEEQQTYMRLSIFQGDFALEGATMVTDATLLILASLMDHSLLHRTLDGHYTLHELIRQYGMDKLMQQPALHQQTADSHCTYFVTQVQKAAAAGIKTFVFEQQMEKDHDNIRSAWYWALEQGNYEYLQCFIDPIAHFYEGKMWRQVLLDFFTETIQRLRTHSPKSSRHTCTLGHLLAYQAVVIFDLDHAQWEQAWLIADESIALLRSQGATRELGIALWIRGLIANETHNDEEAQASLQEAVRLLQHSGDLLMLYFALATLALFHTKRGNYAEAEQRFQEALAVARQTKMDWFIALALIRYATLERSRNALTSAKHLYQQALPLAQKVEPSLQLVRVYLGLGYIAYQEGDYLHAKQCYVTALERRKVIEEYRLEDLVSFLGELGCVHMALHEREAAYAAFADALHYHTRVTDHGPTNFVITELGRCWTPEQPILAAELLAFTRTHPHTSSAVREKTDKLLCTLAAVLPSDVLNQAQQRGQQYTLPDLVRKVLKVLESALPAPA